MGDVQVKLKVMPEGDVDVSGLEDEVGDAVEANGGELVATETEPVAFGLEALMVTVVVPEAEGGSEAVEEALSGIEGVQSVQVEDLSRLM